MSKGKLEPKQERFCQEYLKDLNGTKAAARAGYGNTEESTAVQSARLLKNAKVAERIQELMDKRAARVEIKTDEVLREINRISYSDVRELYTDDGTIKPPHEWPDELARAVSSIKVKEEYEDGECYCVDCGKKQHRQLVGYTKEVKLWNKNHALELAGKHNKLFTDKVEHSAKVS